MDLDDGFAHLLREGMFDAVADAARQPVCGELHRQNDWWSATAPATDGGLALLVFTQRWIWVVFGIVLIVLPHLCGAPQAAEPGGAALAALVHRFVVAATVVRLLAWVALGTLTAYFYQRFKQPNACPPNRRQEHVVPEHHHDHKHAAPQGHGHDHHDHAGHSHVGGHVHAPASFGQAFAIGVGLNVAYVVAEVIYGLGAHSLALLADAGHNVGDVLGLVAAWLAAWLGKRSPAGQYTYGLRGSSILAALGNAVVLLLVTGGIAWEAIQRLASPEPVAGVTIIVVAALGIVVNGVTAWLFMSGRKGDLNIRGAFLHMASDALVAAGTVVAGGLILWTGWHWIDPAISLVISAVIVAGTWGLLRDSVRLALDAVPPGIDRSGVEAYLRGLPGVQSVHDLHIWGMSTTETALTAHLVRPGTSLDDALLHRTSEELHKRFGIGHATLQLESGDPAHPCSLASDMVV